MLRFRPIITQIQKMAYSSRSGGKLDGKIAVVTASTDGIGFAIAKRLAQDGAKVMISSRKEKNVEEAVKKLHSQGLSGVAGIVCHVSKAEDRERLFQETDSKFGGIDILVSNAAANPAVGNVLDCTEEAWDKIFDVNVKSAFLLSREVLPYLKKRGGGSIIYVASIAGLVPMPLLGAYSVSKTALLGLTKSAAQSLGSDNIRVNCLAPGIVKTRFSSAIAGIVVTNRLTTYLVYSALQITETKGDVRDMLMNSIPMRRYGQTDEMGGVVSFLCSDDASYITGETIVASGGMASRL